jgi:N-acetylglutamate synthase-like GNAT family acetyltransferase
MSITIRAARERDREAIAALVPARMQVPDVDCGRFMVATDAGGLAGAVELVEHPDGSRELECLVVRPDVRKRGIAARLIDALLLAARGRLYMVAAARFAAHYAHWGFAPIDAEAAPAHVVRNYLRARLSAIDVAWATGRPPDPLTILARLART